MASVDKNGNPISDALQKAHEKRAAMSAAGIGQDKSVKFSGTDKVVVGSESLTEVELLKRAAARTSLDVGGMTAYVRAVVFAQATVDALRPVQVRKEKTAEDLEKELEALTKRLAAKKAAATAA